MAGELAGEQDGMSSSARLTLRLNVIIISQPQRLIKVSCSFSPQVIAESSERGLPVNDEQKQLPVNEERPQAKPLPHRELDSAQLLLGENEVVIRHGDDVYRLRLTKNGKLILQK